MHHFLHSLTDAILAHLDWFLLGIFILTACLAPRLGDRWFCAAERVFSRFAARRGLAIIVLALIAIGLRVSLLAWDIDPIPIPQYHDEFSYLLAADTFAHGRLTNPTHPLPIFFETFHVLLRPTYMSKYPPAQGAALAVGQVLGHPWIGVLLSVGAMCAAILWMLQGWLPARWALFGGILVALRTGLFNDWVDSYWGGAVAAIGGALVVGALPRIVRSHAGPRTARYPILMGLGAAILANSRPFEGALLFVTVGVALVVWIVLGRAVPLREKFWRVAVPLGALLGVTIAFMAYYNWRVTKSPFQLPYTLYERTYDTSPLFIWQSFRRPIRYNNPQFQQYYNVWAPEQFDGSLSDILSVTWDKITEFFDFFIGKELCIALVALPWLFRDRRARFLLLQFGACFLGLLTVVWFWPHYAAPITATSTALLVQGLRHVRQWKIRNWPIGRGLVRASVLTAIAFVALQIAQSVGNWLPAQSGGGEPDEAARVGQEMSDRANIAAELEAQAGLQLAIVRYAPDHVVSAEWVYNGADLDHGKVVWAREIPGVDIRPLLDYYRNRRIWLVQADENPARLTPYSMPTGLRDAGGVP